MIFGRTLSNESEPGEDAYETKELRGHRQDVTSTFVRTISEESLPREMLEEVEEEEVIENFNEKLAKDVHNKMKKDLVDQKTKTPPPSPEEARIKAEKIPNDDHSVLLKVLKEETEGSNLSSMTPSLTELEAALSDMLEKEEDEEEDQCKIERKELPRPGILVEKNPEGFKDECSTIETRTGDKTNLVDEDFEERKDVPGSLASRITEEDTKLTKDRKVSFCAWEERMEEIDLPNDRKFVEENVVPGRTVDEGVGKIEVSECVDMEQLADSPPEKPSRLHRNFDDSTTERIGSVPTPPRRKNKGSLGVAAKEIEGSRNGSAIVDPYPNDRLI